jgi:ribosomal protein L40E
VSRAPSRLRSAGFILVIASFIRLAELVPAAAVLAQPPAGDSALRGLWLYAVAVVAFHLVVVAIALAFGIGLVRRHEGVSRLFIAQVRIPILLLGALSLFSFVVGVLLSPILLIVVLALVFHPEARRELDEADYERPSFDATMKVLRQREVRERDAVEDDSADFPRERSRSRLCPECDGLNPADAASCRHCGASLAPTTNEATGP